MGEIEIQSFNELHSAVEKHRGQTFIYRGVKSTSYQLIPKLGRYKKIIPSNFVSEEQRILRLFKEQAVPYLTFNPQNISRLRLRFQPYFVSGLCQ